MYVSKTKAMYYLNLKNIQSGLGNQHKRLYIVVMAKIIGILGVQRI